MAKENFKNYQYEIITINSDILEFIKSELDKNQVIINRSVREYQEALANVSWINSFESIIDLLDPYGTINSDSLKRQWKKSWLYESDEPAYYETHISFSQKLGVIKSLLHGKVKITKANESTFINKCIFHKRELPPQINLVFTLMPFTEAWSSNLWVNVIKRTIHNIKDLSLVCKRADDLYGFDVMQDIYESILTCRIVIAEITNRNANVFYELGIAHALGKDVILLSQGVEHIPFDLNRFRHYIYENSEEGYLKLQHYLESAVVEIISKK